MKLGIKLMLAPAITALVALSGAAVNALMMDRQAGANAAAFKDDLRQLHSITHTEENLGKMHAGAYRTMTLIASLDDAAVKVYRQDLKKQSDDIRREVSRLTEADSSVAPDAVKSVLAALTDYAKQADAAVDLASGDPNTGVAMMQSADASFKKISAGMAAVINAIDSAAAERAAAGASRARSTTFLLLGASALATLVVLGLCLGVLRRVARDLRHAADVARQVADGQLDVRVDSQRNDELGDLQQALGAMVQRLADVLRSVQQSAQHIARAGAEIASGNQDLSRRTDDSSGNLQQVNCSLDELTSSVQLSSSAASQASQLAHDASAVAVRGGEVVSQVVQTMDGINDSSRRIADIIGTIDGIAFQTNILALNAAVEAARAGEQGRGFAVVASEVRSLAKRSADAAREIKALISASVERVADGSRQVQAAGATMGEIVSSVQLVSQRIGAVTQSSAQQNQGIALVNGAVVALDQMTQQNSALVAQSASAAQALSDEARALEQIVNRFRLGASVAA